MDELKEKEKGMSQISISYFEYKSLKEQSQKYSELYRQLLEYMGYKDEFLITKAGLKNKLNKDGLVELVLEQRNMIRKLIDDLDPAKRERHFKNLDDLYLNKTN